MNEVLDFTLKLPTLKEMSRFRIARSLWNFPYDDRDLKVSVRDKVRSRISSLPIPKSLQKDLEINVQFVGERIYTLINYRFFPWGQWESRLERKTTLILEYFNNDKLRWTAYGTVDVGHLARLLIRDERVPVANRYEIACSFCFQDEIERIWNAMKPVQFHLKQLKTIKKKCTKLVYYWSYLMKGEARLGNTFRGLNHHISAEERVFKSITNILSKRECHEFSVKYFWNKLTELEKIRQIENLKIVVSIHVDQGYFVEPESLRYLLLQMNLEDQTEILKLYPALFLKCFLNLPWQSLFFPVLRLAEHCQIFTDDLPSFLSRISLDQCDEVMRQRFFDQLRPLFPEHVYNTPFAGSDLLKLLLNGKHEYLLEIMRDATKAQKLDFTMSAYGFYRYSDDLPSVKILVQNWVTHEGWPVFKGKLKRRHEEILHVDSSYYPPLEVDSMSKKFKMFSESLNDHFST